MEFSTEDAKLLGFSFDARVHAFVQALSETPRTQKTYRMSLCKFRSYLMLHKYPAERLRNRAAQSPAPILMGDLRQDSLQGFQEWLSQNKRFTRRTYLAGAKAFLRHAVKCDWLPEAFSYERATLKLKTVKREGTYPIPRPDPNLYKIVEYYDMLALPDGEDKKAHLARLLILRARALVHCYFASAARLSEIAGLDRKHVADGRAKEAIVRGKGDKERVILFDGAACAALRAYLAERADTFEPLFISHGSRYGNRLNTVSIEQMVAEGATAVGVVAHPHDFRHYRARKLLEQGVPLEAIQEILGHSDIGTTRRVYAHYKKQTIREIFDRAMEPRE